MKMVSLIDGVFWGVLLIVVGVWFLVRRYIPFNIPLFRVVIAVILVYIGIRVLVNGPVIHHDRNTMVFSESSLQWSPAHGRDYNVLFSSGTVDLTGVELAGRTVRTEVNVVFGSGTLRLDPAMSVRVNMSSCARVLAKNPIRPSSSARLRLAMGAPTTMSSCPL